jgi:hypothetical protein
MLTAAALAGCGGVQYHDNNAAIDARPECASGPLKPGEKAPAWCDRSTGATWNSDANKSEKVDFKKKDEGGR